jgi:ABC-2 type transport system permease protein
MPWPMRTIGYLIPATHFIEIIRGIVLRGATLSDLWQPVTTLAVMGVVLFILSALRFRKKIA